MTLDTTRRGFLGFLGALGATAIIQKAAPILEQLPSVEPEPLISAEEAPFITPYPWSLNWFDPDHKIWTGLGGVKSFTLPQAEYQLLAPLGSSYPHRFRKFEFPKTQIELVTDIPNSQELHRIFHEAFEQINSTALERNWRQDFQLVTDLSENNKVHFHNTFISQIEYVCRFDGNNENLTLDLELVPEYYIVDGEESIRRVKC